MTLTISSSPTVSPKTLEMIMRAIKLSALNAQELKLVHRQREQKLILAVAVFALLNIATLAMLQYSPDEGNANASRIYEVQSDGDSQNQELAPANEKPIKSTEQRPTATVGVQTPLKSKIIPVFDDSAEPITTIYGELLTKEAIVDAERSGYAPHSQGQGAPIAAPVPPRSKRIDDLIQNRIPLNTQETLYLKKLVDDNERAIYATPDVQQRTVKVKYTEGQISTVTVARNNIATLSFVDKFGNPFPISTLSPKNAGELFTTEIVNQEGTHANVAEIRASKLNGSSNVSVMLVGRTLPAVFKVNLSHAINDATTVVQFDSLAPGYEHVSLPDSTLGKQLCSQDNFMEAVLDGTVPNELVRIETNVAKLQAFRSLSHHYIRSAHQIIDPECTCRIYGVDNLNVCKQPIGIPSVLYVDSITDEFASVALNRDV